MRRYLLVDDNRPLAENLAEILRDEGAEVVIAQNGDQALRAAKAKRFDALLTDMRMPVMTGAELVHHIRRVDPQLPAVVFTAYSGDADLSVARNEGLLAVLPKPTPIPQLIDLLKTARRGGTVAIVEDDAAMADNLTEALRARGFTAVAVGSVLEAERLGDIAPFAALVDLLVPGGPFGEAMYRLEARFPKLPLVVITAHDDPPPMPPRAVLHKPFDMGELLTLLESLYQTRLAA